MTVNAGKSKLAVVLTTQAHATAPERIVAVPVEDEWVAPIIPTKRMAHRKIVTERLLHAFTLGPVHGIGRRSMNQRMTIFMGNNIRILCIVHAPFAEKQSGRVRCPIKGRIVQPIKGIDIYRNGIGHEASIP